MGAYSGQGAYKHMDQNSEELCGLGLFAGLYRAIPNLTDELKTDAKKDMGNQRQ